MHKFSFAVPMIAGVQITAKDEADARRKLALVLDAAATSLGAGPETERRRRAIRGRFGDGWGL